MFERGPETAPARGAGHSSVVPRDDGGHGFKSRQAAHAAGQPLSDFGTPKGVAAPKLLANGPMPKDTVQIRGVRSIRVVPSDSVGSGFAAPPSGALQYGKTRITRVRVPLYQYDEERGVRRIRNGTTDTRNGGARILRNEDTYPFLVPRNSLYARTIINYKV